MTTAERSAKPPPPGEVTQLLKRWGEGDAGALAELVPLVYARLRSLAGSYMRHERADHTLQPTALVHEAFIRLLGQERVSWKSQGQFFALAAQAMRRVLVDHARRGLAARRPDPQGKVALEALPDLGVADHQGLLIVDETLGRLAAVDERAALVVDLRCFAGLSLKEVASALGVSVATVSREWRFARSWLRRELAAAARDAPETSGGP